MKFLVAFLGLLAVASATVTATDPELAQLQAVIAAIQNPSTDPATAALLEQQLLEIYGVSSSDVAGGIIAAPAVVETPVAGVSVVDTPADSGVAVVESPASPVSVVDIITGAVDAIAGAVDSVTGGIVASPAIVEAPVAGGIIASPAIIDFPLPDGGATTEVEVTPVAAPAVISPVAEEAVSSPLVQIILNINGADVSASPVAIGAPSVSFASPERS